MEAGTDHDLATTDLGPLAWVLDELRKSLDSASAALRRFVRDTALARGTDMASVDAGHLRIARQQLHQAVGALEMVGLGAPAHMLRSMEAAVQKFVERPELCNEAASSKVERAGFALTEYLEALLLGKPVSSVSLFPQYRDTQELGGADRIHPADLWSFEWRWNDPDTPAPEKAMVYDPALRARMDQSVLKVVKSGDAQAARELVQTSLALASTQTARQPKVFWKICAAYFEAMGLALLPSDIYVKRAGSRILLQYASLAKGDMAVSDRLAQDLLFFCAQSIPARAEDAPSLSAVRAAWGLTRLKPVDYQTSPFGRFDPALLSQSRKRISAAKETWSSLSGGDASKVRNVGEQFNLVSDSLVKLYPQSAPLAQALSSAVEAVARSGRPPGPELAMEVATALLYLEAAFEDLDPSDTELASRTGRLAERLGKVRQGGQPEPLESWMEELYRRVSDRQTMGSVVGELRGALGELEKLLDQFFRNLQDKAPLRDAPSHLAQMRGVLSVLGLDQAAQAVQRMRESVEEIILTEIDEEKARSAGTFDKLGNNLGALGFLIDMLNYQPSLAKKLFVYDDATGELRPLMGREAAVHPHEQTQDLSRQVEAVISAAPGVPAAEIGLQLDALAMHAVLADQPAVAETAREAAAAVAHSAAATAATAAALSTLAASMKPAPAAAAPATSPMPAADDEDAELLDIFLEEAREVVQNGLAAIQALAGSPSDLGELTTLRRAFHTLKGSSRMVGLNEFGEAGWSMEQVLNTWLADQKPASEELRTLARDAMQAFSRWVDDIAARTDAGWKAGMFRAPADALRTEGRLLPIGAPDVAVEPAAPAEVAAPIAFTEQAAALEEIELSQPAIEAPVLVEEVPPAFADAFFELPSLDLPAVEPGVAAQPPEPVADAFDLIEEVRAEPPQAEELPAGELPPDFEFDFAPAAATAGSAPESEQPLPVTEPVEIEGIDFAALEALSQPQAEPEVEPEVEPQAEPEVEPVIEAAPVAEAVEMALDLSMFEAPPVDPDEERGSDEQVKVIGSLRIGIPLYNVYLNEADEWSRRLATEIAEWALELNEPVPDSAVGLAHALAGSSATVGFETLSDVARALESALGRTQRLAFATRQHGKAFTDAADEIRRLLHQFAAGFLKDANPSVIEAMDALQALDIPQRMDLPSGFGEDDDDAAARAFVEEHAAQARDAEPASQPAPLMAEPDQTDPAVQAILAAHAVQAQPAPLVRTVTGFADDQEDIDIADAVDPDLFPIFEEEAVELMPQLGGALRQWSSRPDNRSARDEALRALHTLKGSARLAGALRLGELAHRLESEIEHLGSDNVATQDLEALLHRFDGMQANLDALRQRAAMPVEAPPVEAQPSASLTLVAEPVTLPQAVVADLASFRKPRVAPPVVTQHGPQRAAANQSVRVRAQLLDRLVNQAGEVMITRTRLETELRQLRVSLTDLTGNLDRLRSQLRDIELQAETQMQSRLAQAKEAAAGFDPLEFDRFTRVQELTRMMAESVNDVATVQRNIQRTVEATEDDLVAQARQTRELQRDLLRTRMVEFEGISDRLYRVVRLASKETAKQVKLDISGGTIEMDRGVLDRMTPAFEHLLRNCVAHGIEDPETRAASGKEPAGTILITLRQEGNDVSVEFRDDGAGLNLKRIREKAVQQGMVPAGQEISDQEAAQLIFMPGFSTAAQVTELSGRGIGMDVVRAEVNALGGRIETTTAAGEGTSFRLVLPLTTAVTQVVMMRAGGSSVGVPANIVEIVRRATAAEVAQAYESGFYDFGGEKIPFYWSGALLQSSARSLEVPGKTLPVVIFRSAAQRIAVHVDEVLGNQEVVVKNLGPQLARLPGLAGMSLLASGAVVLIYNPVALSTVFGEQARRISVEAAPSAAGGAAPQVPAMPAVSAVPQVPLVMVVDDSITVRRVTQRLLQREGYRVVLAADGLQALERLADEKPAVVLSDIEMPRMDGFDLARNIRGDSRLKDLPIIMITSRIAEKHREHARELGVDHYLGKPYSEDELLGLVRHYTAALALA